MVADKLVRDGGYCPEWLCVALRLNHLYHPELDDVPLWYPIPPDDSINIYRWYSGDGYGRDVALADLNRPYGEQNEGYFMVSRESGYIPVVVRFDRFRPTFFSSQKVLKHRTDQRFVILDRFMCQIPGYHIRFEDGEELDAWCGEVCMPDHQHLYDKVLEDHKRVHAG